MRMFIINAILFSGTILSIMYILYLIRDINQGKFLMEILATGSFGYGLFYLVEGTNNLLRGEKISCMCSYYLFGMCFYIWYRALLLANIIAITRESVITEYTGFFGIQGFWGIGVIIPIYIIFVAIMMSIFSLIDRIQYG